VGKAEINPVTPLIILSFATNLLSPDIKCKTRPSLTTSKDGQIKLNIQLDKQQEFNSGFG
jgi:hypothetical protein